MSQTVSYWIEERQVRRELPDAEQPVFNGIYWGNHWELFTPAYWKSQIWMHDLDHQVHSPYKAKGSLTEEVVFCLLGGFGITAELSMAAYDACEDAGLIASLNTSPEAWSEALRKPMQINGKSIHYRYPNQKAIYLASAMRSITDGVPDLGGGRALRDSLLKIRGIGPKTAGWVARNFLDSDEVAILDIHIVRAGLLCDLFAPSQKVERDYMAMEEQYIQFCQAMGVRPAVLDCLVWDQMRTVGQLAIDAVKEKYGSLDPSHSKPAPRQPVQLPLQ